MIWHWAVLGICGVAAGYQLFALIACLNHVSRRRSGDVAFQPAVSILKPVRGLRPGFDEALRSHAEQDYPEFELLVGHRNPSDSAIPAIEQAIAGYSGVVIRDVVCPAVVPNGKVGVLLGLAEQARHSVWIVNDADIAVPPGYIQAVTQPLADPSVGLVTCLYRAEGESWPARFEALGVAADFAPSALVAPFAGVSEFGFGSTLAFRRADLERIGGFRVLADFLADDYQLGAKIHQLGFRNIISHVVVQTRLYDSTWSDIWRHQLRWARTVRLSRPDGYIGLPLTFATLWVVLAAACGFWWVAFGLLAVRLAMALTAGWFVLGSRDVPRFLWAIPLRDLYGVAVWAAGLFGDTVEWGGESLRLDSQGRILKREPMQP